MLRAVSGKHPREARSSKNDGENGGRNWRAAPGREARRVPGAPGKSGSDGASGRCSLGTFPGALAVERGDGCQSVAQRNPVWAFFFFSFFN